MGDAAGLKDYFELPEGAVANGCVAICQYLDADGEMKFGYIYDTHHLPLSSTLGLLELAKQHIYGRSLEEEW
jgi:hypothetical protein